jgi:hypothetical protein
LRHRLAKHLIAPLIAAAAVGFAFTSVPAGAQGFFQRLLDQLRPEQTPAAPQTTQPRVITLPDAPAGKDENAVRLLVVGDFMARGVADALKEAFADEPGLEVIDRSNGSSGIVRDDFYDWAAVLPGILAEVQPSYVVMMIGTNDRQGLRTEGQFALRSEDWDRVYAERVNHLADILAPFGAQAYWVGEPPMRSRSVTTDMVFFNSVYEAAANRVGIDFIDIWDAFADQEGRFTINGPGVDGQDRVLRGDDGYSLTRAGAAKVAFFVRNEIELSGSGENQFVAVPNAGGVEILPGGVPRVVGPVMVIGDPPPGAAAELATAPTELGNETLAYQLLVRGDALPTVPGRADDFTWPLGADGVSDGTTADDVAGP